MKPTPDELRRLYEIDRLTKNEVGRIYGVSASTVGRWFAKFGITARPGGTGLATKGMSTPTKDELAKLIEVDHMSCAEIGDTYGVNRTAVNYWLSKYGMATPKRLPKFPDIDDEDVVRLYESGRPLLSISRKYGVALKTIRAVCINRGVEIRPRGFKPQWLTCDDGQRVRSSYELQVANWLISRGLHYVYEPRYPFNKHWCADFAVNGWFVEIWGVESHSEYATRRMDKIRLCGEHGIPLISLKSHHFGPKKRDLLAKLLSAVMEFPASKGIPIDQVSPFARRRN